ncbi:MAG TPA: DnaB-like helicase C-terminal domain-containing protein, partial [Chlamydiales bacterium]|nr:DnaB-like helicase C-terminal domain-containing protein [Chlamydiales bacterium]
DQPGLKITDIRARARRMKESHNIGLLVIDYLQLISGSGGARNIESRQNEISEISRMLKTLARELNIPVLCIAQLSRKVEERAGHKPMMSDLRESGCLAADTLIVDAKSGKRYTIKELATRKKQTAITVHAIDPKTMKLGQYNMVKAFSSGRKMLYELKTRSGRIIQASANHPFLKLEGWTALENLKPGCRIGLPRQLQCNKLKKTLPKEELILLAHLIGDGCILEKQPYHYTSANQDNLDAVAQAAKKLFSIEPRYVKQKNWYHIYLPSPYRLTHKKKHPITLWFEKLGLQRVRSYEKKLPEALFEQDNDHIALFLKHLWSTDGNLSKTVMKGRQPA